MEREQGLRVPRSRSAPVASNLVRAGKCIQGALRGSSK